LLQGKYLETQPNSLYSRVGFSANDEDSPEEFVLFFRKQNQQAGLLVDICSLAGHFLRMRDSYVVANSCNAPDNKFLIVPLDDDVWL
jgi:hypothetical protein